MISIKSVEANDVDSLRIINDLANSIWREHYIVIIGTEQVEYMLNKFQSVHSISNQIKEEGYKYYLLSFRDDFAGYIGIKVEDDALFLSKLYVDKKYRNKGIAKKGIEFLMNFCIENNLKKIWLTVNKYNSSSISVYNKLGFLITNQQVSDIGGGFVMDDYIMEKKIT